MITPEERASIVAEAVEATLKMLPSVINNMMSQASAMTELKGKFYAENKDFQEHRPIVAQVIEQMELANPGEGMEKLLVRATPEIRRRIATIKTIVAPGARKLSLSDLDHKISDHGTI